MMKTSHTPKTASCLYMLGFASGLLFIVLCGGSTIYEEFEASLRNADAPSVKNEVPAPDIAQADVPAPGEQTSGDLEIKHKPTDAGGELSILGLGFEPGEKIVVTVVGNGITIASQDTTASEVGGLFLVINLPDSARGLDQVDIVAASVSNRVSKTFSLSGNGDVGSGPTATLPAASPTPLLPTCTCTPTSPPPPPTVTPSPTPTPALLPTRMVMSSLYPNWCGEYFNNPFFQGEPAQTRDDPVIAFDWGEGSPAPGAIGKNWFSVRWIRELTLPEGKYDFVLSANDQAEVFMNDTRILSHTGGGGEPNRASFYITGPNPVKFVVQYAEYWGEASVYFYWEPSAGQGLWNISYYQGSQWAGDVKYVASYPSDNLQLTWDRLEDQPWHPASFDAPFSALVTRQLQAPGRPGPHHICFYTYGNARLWLDSSLLADVHTCYEKGCFVCTSADLRKHPVHHLTLEYAHVAGESLLGVWTFPNNNHEPWIAGFYTNTALSGLPAFLQTLSRIDLDWGGTAPDPRLSADQFGLRLMRSMELENGRHRFHIEVDDGARLRINDKTLVDAWVRGPARPYEAVYDVLADKEMVDVELDYFEQGGLASLKFWHEPPPTPTPTATATATFTPTPRPPRSPTRTPVPPPSPTLCCVTPTPCCVTPVPGSTGL